ncbi:MAG: SMC-Scp complex subunit ScpB [Pseudomonadota bacterium]
MSEATSDPDSNSTDGAVPAPSGTLPPEQIERIVEAALQAADEPLTADRLYKLFLPGELADEGGRGQIRVALKSIEEASAARGVELRKVASGYRMQVRQEFSPWVSRLWDEKPPRYTRALLETLALIAYKQPATRGDIEEVRGVAVSPNIMRTLLERGWIREVGQRDVAGRPSMYGTTKAFLDYFNLATLGDLPTLPEVRELIDPQIEAVVPETPSASSDSAGGAEAESAADPEVQQQADGDAEADTATAADPAAVELDAPLTVRESGASVDEGTEAEPASEPAASDADDRPSADVVVLPGVETREDA